MGDTLRGYRGKTVVIYLDPKTLSKRDFFESYLGKLRDYDTVSIKLQPCAPACRDGDEEDKENLKEKAWKSAIIFSRRVITRLEHVV